MEKRTYICRNRVGDVGVFRSVILLVRLGDYTLEDLTGVARVAVAPSPCLLAAGLEVGCCWAGVGLV